MNIIILKIENLIKTKTYLKRLPFFVDKAIIFQITVNGFMEFLKYYNTTWMNLLKIYIHCVIYYKL